MAIFKAQKVVGSLPSPLEPDTIYLVRVGTGFEFHVTDDTGNVAHKSNASDWGDILNKPTVFPPEEHGHEIYDVTGLEDALATFTPHTHFRDWWEEGIEYKVGDVVFYWVQITVYEQGIAFCVQDHTSSSENRPTAFSVNPWVYVPFNPAPLEAMSFYGNPTDGWDLRAISIPEAKTMLSYGISDIPGLQDNIDAKLNSSLVSTFALTLLDDTTNTAMRTTLGLGAAAIWTAVPANHITNTRLADMPAYTFKGRLLGTAGDPVDLTVTQAKTLLAIEIADVTGLSQQLGDLSTGISTHVHTIAQVTGLQTALDGKAALSHIHQIAEITDLQTTLDDKANASHSHTIANVTGLQTALNDKAAATHTHEITSITNLQSMLTALTNRVTALEEAASVEPEVPTLTAPASLTGIRAVGNTITVIPGSATGAPTPTRAIQWLRGSTAISGATGTTYTTVSNDEDTTLTARVTWSNSAGPDVVSEASSYILPALQTDEMVIVADNEPFTVYVQGTDNPANPFLVSHHGLSAMTARSYYGTNGARATLDTIAFSPWFNSPRFDNTEYQRGGYPDGNKSADLEEPLVDAIRAYLGHPDRPAIIYGHSAGGQWLSRVSAYAPVNNTQRYLVANPSTFVWPSAAASPYGFGDMGLASIDDAIKEYLQRPITIYVGENDNDPGDPDLGDPSNTLGQGTQRRDRAENAYAAAVAAASAYNVPLNWEKVTAAGVGHSGGAMLAAPELLMASYPPVGDHAVRLAVNSGVGAGLKFAVDPASSLSYPGTGQYVYDFMRNVKMMNGASASADGADMAFTGTPNALDISAYLETAGADYLTMEDSTPAWLNNMHKSTAAFTIAVMARLGGDVGVGFNLIGNTGNVSSARVGFVLGFSTSGQLAFGIRNGSGTALSGTSSGTGAIWGDWAVYMMAFEAGVSRRLSRNSVAAGYITATGGFALTTPATGDATHKLQIGASGNGTDLTQAGTRFGPVLIWDRALESAELELFSGNLIAART